jgi:hypothetical protein
MKYGLNQIVEGKAGGKFVVIGIKAAEFSPSGKAGYMLKALDGNGTAMSGQLFLDEESLK